MCREISFLIKEKGGWCLSVMHWEPNGGWFSTKRATPGNDGSMSDYPVGSPREIVEVHLEVFFCKRTCKNRNPKFLKTQQQKHCKDWKSPVYIGIFLNQQKKTRLLLSTPSNKTTNKTEECNLCWARWFRPQELEAALPSMELPVKRIWMALHQVRPLP